MTGPISASNTFVAEFADSQVNFANPQSFASQLRKSAIMPPRHAYAHHSLWVTLCVGQGYTYRYPNQKRCACRPIGGHFAHTRHRMAEKRKFQVVSMGYFLNNTGS